MSEESMEKSVQEALAREGIADEVLVAGQFSPRGHSGSLALGGMAGDSLGGIGGAAGAAVGTIAGMAGATEGTDALRGLPDHMVVGVTADAVYGFAGATKAGPALRSRSRASTSRRRSTSGSTSGCSSSPTSRPARRSSWRATAFRSPTART